MPLLPTRRGLVTGLAGAALASGAATGAYGIVVEPLWRLEVRRHAPALPRWPSDLRLRVAVLADFHVGEPFMGPDRIAEIVSLTNALQPDLVILLGDYEPGHAFNTREVSMPRFAAEMERLRAPLGVLAVLGNHDWWADPGALDRTRPTAAAAALEARGIGVLENRAVRLVKDGRPFWIAGLADQMALHKRGVMRGFDDLPRTLAALTDAAPAILVAHEPYIFRRVPGRIALTLSGHTHGGQVRIFGIAPMMRTRYLHGHVVDNDRHIVISAGLGTSKFPVRIGVPPEVVIVDLGTEAKGPSLVYDQRA